MPPLHIPLCAFSVLPRTAFPAWCSTHAMAFFYASNCACAFAVRFHSGTSVAGYDPEKYLKQYRDAGSDVNAMRRIDYAARKDAINARKRAAYQLRQKNRGQKVFITDQAIQKVPLVAPNGADHQTALFIQETHRELLNLVLCQMLG